MPPAALEIGRRQVEGAKLLETRGPCLRELIEQLDERFAAAVALLRQPIEPVELLRLAELENPSHAGNPVGPLAVNQVANDVEGAPGAGTFVWRRPCVGQVPQQRVQRAGRSLQQRDRLFETV